MENFLKKISQKFNSIKSPRIKVLGVFLIVIGFAAETPLRNISHVLADGLLMSFGKEIVSAGSIADKIFTLGAPLLIIYIPLTIILWMIIRDGFQGLDWISGPLLIGVLIKTIVYGVVSLHYKTGEFWELTQYSFLNFWVYFLIAVFLISVIVGLIQWFREIL